MNKTELIAGLQNHILKFSCKPKLAMPDQYSRMISLNIK